MSKERKDRGVVPMSSGFYWAKYEGHKWFNLIVAVDGEAPFFRMRAWDLGLNERLFVPDFDDIFWGPRIADPDEAH